MDLPVSAGNYSKLLTACFCMLLMLVACSKERQALKIGDPAPVFTAQDLEGRTFSLASFRGGPVILRFWSTDCKFCRADTPVFNRFFEEYRNQGLGMAYINMEAVHADLVKFVEELKIEFPVISDPKGRIASRYHVKLVPQTIILDSDHRIIAAIIGGVSEEELYDLLSPYLQMAKYSGS